MEKVFCVFQPSGSYDDYSYDLKGVCKTIESAEKLKNKLDEMVVSEDNIYTIIPKDIFENWPFICEDEENDIWFPEVEYEGYTYTQYMEQEDRHFNYICEISPAVIEDYDLL